jgi:hypothetical protein
MNDSHGLGVKSQRSGENLFGCRFRIECRFGLEHQAQVLVAADFEAVDRCVQRAGVGDPETMFIDQRETLIFSIPHGGVPGA